MVFIDLSRETPVMHGEGAPFFEPVAQQDQAINQRITEQGLTPVSESHQANAEPTEMGLTRSEVRRARLLVQTAEAGISLDPKN